MRTPKPTFKVNIHTGEGSIGNWEKFRELDMMFRADLLQDWLFEIDAEYSKTLAHVFKSKVKTLNENRKKIKADQKKLEEKMKHK
jgi:hypothetical protein